MAGPASHILPVQPQLTTQFDSYSDQSRPDRPRTTPAAPTVPDSPQLSPVLTSKTSRPRLSRPLSRPPTSGGGPLTSHPTHDSMPTTTSSAMPGAFPTDPEPEATNGYHTTPNNMSFDSGNNRDRSSTVDSPSSPSSSGPNAHSSDSPRRPAGVRRLFSLSSLRQSFSSSRTSLSIRPDTSHGSTYRESTASQRPQSPSIMSTTASTAQAPSMHSQRQSTLRKKRSSNWFKRKSGFFGMNDDGTLDVLDEDGPEHKRFKDNALPVLPEISTLSGGELDGGHIGWDDGLFKHN